MSLCTVSACLLVLLGAVLASGHPIQSVSEKMKNEQDIIANELNLKQPEISSKPLFGSVLKNINTSCQRKDDVKLMNATLDVYLRIFSSILHNHPGRTTSSEGLLTQVSGARLSEVRVTLERFKEKMETMKTRLSHQNHNREDLLSTLNKIEVDDLRVQKKALAEFLEVYQAASVVVHTSC